VTLHVLIPFDGGQASRAALSWTAGLQRSVHGLSIHLVQIVPAIALSTGSFEHVEESLARVVQELGAIASGEVIVSSEPGPAIVAAAKQLGSDLIVLSAGDSPPASYIRLHAACVVVTFGDHATSAFGRANVAQEAQCRTESLASSRRSSMRSPQASQKP
jgi:nucleotide-binding universal stress UspA family protein